MERRQVFDYSTGVLRTISNFEESSGRRASSCPLGSRSALALAVLIMSLANPAECSPNGVSAMLGSRRHFGRQSERREVGLFGSRHSRRFSDLIPVRDRIRNAVCTYEVIADVNYQRIPSKIDRVICKAEDCAVIEDSDFRCVQLYAQLNVTFPMDNCRMEFELMNIEYACICARSIGSTRVTIIEPVFV